MRCLNGGLHNNTQNDQFLYYKVAEVKSIQELLGKVIEEILHPLTLPELTIKLHMGLLIVELVRHSDKLERMEEASTNHFLVVESFKHIADTYKDASLYEPAGCLNQSYYGLSKTIKRYTLLTFKDLLQARRLEKAKELLIGSEIAILTVAENVGYDDNISYFYRIFKGKSGMTPKEMRNIKGSKSET